MSKEEDVSYSSLLSSYKVTFYNNNNNNKNNNNNNNDSQRKRNASDLTETNPIREIFEKIMMTEIMITITTMTDDLLLKRSLEHKNKQ